MRVLSILLVLLFASPCWAVDIASVFGSGTNTCSFFLDKTSIQANGSDTATLRLAVNGAPYTNPVTITEISSGQVHSGVTIPSGGMPITASAPGTWSLQVNTLAGCPTVMLQAH